MRTTHLKTAKRHLKSAKKATNTILLLQSSSKGVSKSWKPQNMNPLPDDYIRFAALRRIQHILTSKFQRISLAIRGKNGWVIFFVYCLNTMT